VEVCRLPGSRRNNPRAAPTTSLLEDARKLTPRLAQWSANDLQVWLGENVPGIKKHRTSAWNGWEFPYLADVRDLFEPFGISFAADGPDDWLPSEEPSKTSTMGKVAGNLAEITKALRLEDRRREAERRFLAYGPAKLDEWQTEFIGEQSRASKIVGLDLVAFLDLDPAERKQRLNAATENGDMMAVEPPDGGQFLEPKNLGLIPKRRPQSPSPPQSPPSPLPLPSLSPLEVEKKSKEEAVKAQVNAQPFKRRV
jgi:hypothetical protein